MARLTLDWYQVAELLGAMQGLLLAAVLFAQRTNRTANRLLAALMASFTLYLASNVYYSAGLITTYPHFFAWSYPLPWVFGPLVYLYARAASDRAWRLTPRQALHFVPLAITTLNALPYLLMSGADKIAVYTRLVSGDVPARITLLEPTKYLSGIAYSVATIVSLRRHRRRVEDSYSNTARVNLRWLLWFASAAAGVWLIATVLRLSDLGQRLREEHVSLAIALLVYAIGYMGLRQPEVFRYETAEMPVFQMEDAMVAATAAAPALAPMPMVSAAAGAALATTTVVEPARYERSGLSDGEAVQLEARLRVVMERDTPWKESELTLAELAGRLQTTPHKLSEVLNGRVGQTFYDFVNGYRVREVQRRIEGGDARRLKMLAIALDAGFASKSTFNDAFKKHTGHTPSAYRATVAD